jgi:hypothetical protein
MAHRVAGGTSFEKKYPAVSADRGGRPRRSHGQFWAYCIDFDNEWNSHLTIVIRNGEAVGYGDSGVNVGEFEAAI